MAIGRLGGHGREGVGHPGPQAVASLPKAPAQLRVRRDGQRPAQPGEVEALGGRGEGHRDGSGLGGQGGGGSVPAAVQDQIVMDLVGNDDRLPAAADFHQALELLGPPDPPHRVVGAAQHHQGSALAPGPVVEESLETLEVHAVALPLEHERVLRHMAAVGLDARAEGVVHRGLEHHPVSGTGVGQNRQAHGGHHPRAGEHRAAGNAPAMAPVHPVDDGLVVALRLEGVAEHAVVQPPAQGLEHRRGSREIHIRHPQGQQIGGLGAPQRREAFGVVPLQRARSPAVDKAIEIDPAVKVLRPIAVVAHGCPALSPGAPAVLFGRRCRWPR